MSDTVISVENVSKRYYLGLIGSRTLSADVERWWARVRGRPDPLLKVGEEDQSKREGEAIWALRDVSFQVQRGEVLGIIGRNGAGKSTLLKILSRITTPTRGQVRVKGRIASLLEVGTGFHPELTGRENIYLNGAILGMGRAEIGRKFDEIVAFAEIDKFIDTPVKRYSSGMYVRLAFAVAAHLEPEILLVDEVLAVGDAAFQKKCLGKMGEVAGEGRTVLLVSHNMGSIRELCPRCLWIDEGRIRETGPTAVVIGHYLRTADKSEGKGVCTFAPDEAKEFQLLAAVLRDRDGRCTHDFSCDHVVSIEMLCQVRRPVPGLYGYLLLSRTDGTRVLEADSFDVLPNGLDGLPVGMHLVRFDIPDRSLGPGEYVVYVNFGSITGAKGFDVDTPGTMLSFRLDDSVSRRGNRRLGHFSTLIPWQVSRPPEALVAALSACQSGTQATEEEHRA